MTKSFKAESRLDMDEYSVHSRVILTILINDFKEKNHIQVFSVLLRILVKH